MTYTKPDEVRSPREHLILICVLLDQGEGTAAAGGGRYSIAIVEWDGVRRLAIRWNGTKQRPAGNPQSRGIATWFVLPPGFEGPLAAVVPKEKLPLLKALMNAA